MAFTNYDSKEINCKIIYFGPPQSGKTANLRAVFNATSADVRAGLVELGDAPGATQFFDFLPVSLGQIYDFHVKLHLYTLPINRLFGTLNSVILRGVDGFVFVADSRLESMGDNLDALLAAKNLLSEEGYNVSEMPRVIQYNKRDATNAVPIDLMRQELNPVGFSDVEAVAINAVGTLDTLNSMAKLVVKKLAV